MALKELHYKDHVFLLSYELTNTAKQKSLLILHGWGSNKQIMKQAFSKHLLDYKQIYIDMPGFGKSTNEMILTTADYAQILKLFLTQIEEDPQIIMGHSFGGKVATLLDPKCLILLSSSGILVPKPYSIRAKIFIFKMLKSVGLNALRDLFVSSDAKGMSQNMYETFKNVVDEPFENNFKNAKPECALLFWGKEDTATPLWTAKKISSIMQNAKLYPLDGDHFFFMQHAKFIAQSIEEKIKEN